MASIESVDFYDVVLTSMTEDGMSFDDALKEFLERFERSLLNFDWIEANFHGKNAEFLKGMQVRAAQKYQNAKEKYKNSPEGLLLWIANILFAFQKQE